MNQRTSRRALRVVGSATAVSFAVALASCSGGSGGSGDDGGDIELTFQWWGNDERAALTEEAIDLFEQNNPGITVSGSFSTIDSYIPKLATQIASNSAPDLFLIPMESVKEYSEKGATLDLTDYIGDQISVDEISEASQKIGVVGGTTYGFTLGTATSAWIYNPSVWEEAGAEVPAGDFAWEELLDAGEKIRASTGGDVAAISDPGGYIAWFATWLNQQGKIGWTEDGQLGFEASDLEAWFELMEKLRESGATTDAETTTTIDQSMQNSGLARGESAGEFAAASLTGAYADTIGAENVALAPLPSDTDVLAISMAGTNVAAIAANSEHPEETAQFLDFLINDPGAAEILKLTRGIPINQANYEALMPDLEGADKAIGDFVTTYQDRFSEPDPLAPPGATTIPADFTLAYESIIFEQSSIEDAAASLFEKFEATVQ
ncbi:MAG: ABC transporter substrate-binding protein [Microbacterium gubbeenense]|uniref:ABC transporter substrate-binding protein n=1 Tax=Microbacterium gubbeenense TaxID=159896 RepID=UPI003F9688FA